MNNYTPHLKPPNKIQIRRAALGQPEMKLLCGGGVGGLGGGGVVGLQLVCSQLTLAIFCSALVPKTLIYSVCLEDS